MAETSRKVALITGGAAVSAAPVRLISPGNGFDIVLVDLIEDDLARTAHEIADLGREALTFLADVREHKRAADIVAEVDAAWGRIDVLFNNAGRPMPKGSRKFQSGVRRHDRHQPQGCLQLHPADGAGHARNGGGRIINMSSMNAHTGGVTSAVSKFHTLRQRPEFWE